MTLQKNLEIFYDALDNWWHQNGNLIKHVNAFTNDIDEVMGDPKFQKTI